MTRTWRRLFGVDAPSGDHGDPPHIATLRDRLRCSGYPRELVRRREDDARSPRNRGETCCPPAGGRRRQALGLDSVAGLQASRRVLPAVGRYGAVQARAHVEPGGAATLSLPRRRLIVHATFLSVNARCGNGG